MGRQYWGKETKAALRNFPFSAPGFPKELIDAIAEIKEAAARANAAAGLLDAARASAVIRASREIRARKMDNQFPVSALQGGAGTSLNANMNEVLAARATEILKQKKRSALSVHPNDHVNRSQSTNDVNPSALKIASLRLGKTLDKVLDGTVKIFTRKAREFSAVHKLGRTHLQDAVPTTLGEEFSGYAATLERAQKRISETIPYFYELNLGGTAIGNSVNAPPKYRASVYRHLTRITRIPLVPAKNPMSLTASQTDFCMLSSALTLLALDLSKIANDLRMLSSGPRGGFGEIHIQSLQAGSTIMPGKTNPVLLEAINQLYFTVAGNNLAIQEAAHAAQLELGVMWPTIAEKLLSSFILTAEVVRCANKFCFSSIKADKKRCLELLEKSSAYAAFLAPRLGYDAVAALVQESTRTGATLRTLVIRKKLLSQKEFDGLVRRRMQ